MSLRMLFVILRSYSVPERVLVSTISQLEMCLQELIIHSKTAIWTNLESFHQPSL